MKEDIIKAKRYNKSKLECLVFWVKAGLDPLIANAVKYVWRYKYKNGIEDLYKSRVYLERALELMSEVHFSEREYVLRPSDVEDFTDKQFLFVHLSTKTTVKNQYAYYCDLMIDLLNDIIEEEKEK